MISVIVPIAKMANRLQNLSSWLTQLGSLQIQVILVHDVQDESTGPELDAILSTLSDSRITLVNGLFGAPGLARNAGLLHVTGDWICFWDSDDIPYPSRVVKVVSLANEETELIIGQFEYENELTGECIDANPVQSINTLINNPGIWRMIFRTESISGTTFSAWRLGEDQLFLEEFDLDSRKVSFVQEKLYRYFHGGKGHLTSNRELLIELHQIVKSGSKLILNYKGPTASFVTAMYSRQVVTCLLHGSISLKVLSTVNFLITFMRASLNRKRELCRAPILILGNKGQA
jgi:glycosyltransferase involved in cell wall biosynthesis